MPWGDGTGPIGQGPMTGRAAGYCAGYSVPGYMNPVGGRGFWGRGRGWFGRGGGRGWRHWYYATGLPGWARARGWFPPYVPAVHPYAGVSRDEEMNILKEQAKYLKEELDAVSQRLKDLESAGNKEDHE